MSSGQPSGFLRALWLMGAGLFSGVAGAADAVPTVHGGDVAWMIVASVFVLMMSIPGLALFYSGLVRVKNAISLQVQVLLCFVLVLLAWMVFGHAVVFSDWFDLGAMGKRLLLMDIKPDSTVAGSDAMHLLPTFVYVIFQGAFAAITCALIVGALAERARLMGVLFFVLVWFVLSYIPIAHFVWHRSAAGAANDGWLAGWGILDFAGGLVVHLNAGIAGLVASYMIDARKDFGQKPLAPHSLNSTLTGSSLLWLGWIGFNAGSALGANGLAGLAFVCTVVSPAVGCLTWVWLEYRRYGKATSLGAASGILAGLVAVTPAAGYVAPWAAMVIGFCGAFVSFKAISLVKRQWKIDDALDVFAIHGACGLVGSILVGIFAFVPMGGAIALPAGSSAFDAIVKQLGLQLLGVAVVLAISALGTYLAMNIAHRTVGMRADAADEEEGLDAVDHAEAAYNFLNE
jgi:Amt family ammonium transporter